MYPQPEKAGDGIDLRTAVGGIARGVTDGIRGDLFGQISAWPRIQFHRMLPP